MSNPVLKITSIVYGSQTSSMEDIVLSPDDVPVSYTRTDIAKWLNISPNELNAITRQPRGHFSIDFDRHQQQFFVERSYSPTMTLNGRPINEYSFLQPGQNRLLFKANGNNDQITLCLAVQGDNVPTSSGNPTLPTDDTIYHDDNWDWLVYQLKTKRIAHIWGMPGVGKSHLLRHILDHNFRSQERRIHEGLPNLIGVPVNGKAIAEDPTKDPLWYKLLYQMLTELETVCDRYRLDPGIVSNIGNTIASMDNHNRPPGMNPAPFKIYLTRALLPLTTKRFFVTFVLDSFDEIYAEAPNNVLITLHDFHKRTNSIALILVTYAPLDHIRSSLDSLSRLFMQADLQIKRFDVSRLNHKLTNLLPDINQHIEPSSVADTLYSLTGGHPKITKGFWEELKTQKIANSPHVWRNTLRDISKNSNTFLSFLEIWHALQPSDQEAIQKKIRQQRLSSEETSRLQAINILDEDNRLFSPIFESCISLLHAGTAKDLTIIRNKETGDIDVLIGNIPVTEKVKGQGEPLKILAYLYESDKQACSEEDLIRKALAYDSVSKYSKDSLRQHVNRTNERLTGGKTSCYIVKIKTGHGSEYRLYTQPQPKNK